jgi:hypothetical protein
MFKGGDVESRDFCTVVIATQADGVAVGGVSLEFVAFGFTHDATLQRQTEARGRGYAGEIGGGDRAEISLGGNVEADWLGDLGAEMLREPRAAGLFMLAIQSASSEVLILAVEQVSHVMQERRHDERV